MLDKQLRADATAALFAKITFSFNSSGMDGLLTFLKRGGRKMRENIRHVEVTGTGTVNTSTLRGPSLRPSLTTVVINGASIEYLQIDDGVKQTFLCNITGLNELRGLKSSKFGRRKE